MKLKIQAPSGRIQVMRPQRLIVDRVQEMSPCFGHNNFAKQHNKQSGQALIIYFLVLVLVASVALVSVLDSNSVKNERDKKTAAALEKAKTALIGWAATQTTLTQLGQLPCPEDTTLIGSLNEGSAKSSCTLPAIGRLPWRSLGLGDLRDGNNDKLWYAISAGFRSNTINSDTPAQLTVDGVVGSAVAIIFSPGTPLGGQTRPIPTSATPPVVTQYLDLSNNDGDNTFVTSGAVNSFNDRLMTISHDELFAVVEKRVANEALNCLKQYDQINSGGLDRHPWTTDLATGSYNDVSQKHFGRIPDAVGTPFLVTAGSDSNSLMSNKWPAACNITSGTGWWLNWRELVFYAVAWDKDPAPFVSPPCDDDVPNDCLTIVTPSGTQNHKKVVVIVAGRMLTGQSRSSAIDKKTLSNYLEGGNNPTPLTIAKSASGFGLENAWFEQKPATATFNDVVVFY